MSPSISSSDGGLSPSVPILSRPLGVRPGRDRGFPPIVSDLVEPLAVHPRPRPGFLPFPTDLDRHRPRQTSRRPSPLSTEPPSIRSPRRLLAIRPRLRPGLLSSVPVLGEPLDVHPRPLQACHCQPSAFAGALAPSVGKLVAVHLQLRRGFSASVPILGRPLAVRPGLDRDSRRPSPAPTTLLVLPAVDRGFYRSSQALAGLTPPASDFDQACRCPSPALTGVFAVRPDTGQTSGGSTRP